MYEEETVWEFDMVDRIRFGNNASRELSSTLNEMDADSVLFITDPGLEDAGVIDQLTGTLDEQFEVDVFSEVTPDPDVSVFTDAVERARDVEPDALIGVGGGSSMDVAKTTSIIYAHGGEILDYVAPPTGEGTPIPGPGLPTVAVPTTAGTGAETSPVSVISLPDRDLKVGISSRHQYPDAAIIDPLLTVSLPSKVTASSGIDALTHAIEAYTTRRFDQKERPESPADRPDYNGRTMFTDQLARTAIRLISDNLRRAVNNGQDVEARRNMALASLMAGVAFTNAGLGAAHAMAMAVGAKYETPHGDTIAAVLPEVMEYNAPATFDRYGEIAQLMGKNVQDADRTEAAYRGADAVRELIADVGLPESLSELGVNEEGIPEVVDKTSQLQRLLVGNPRRVTEDELQTLYRNAL